MSLQINSNDRVLITGKTGSGKTYLASYLTKPLSRLIVVDTKGTLGGWGLEKYEPGLHTLLRNGDARVRAVPPIQGDMEEWGYELFADAYRCGNVTLYIDEMYSIVQPGQKPPQSLIACYTRGRELGVGVWASTQRPVWIPLFSLSEADHFFVFRLSLEEDRKRMSAFMGPSVLQPITDVHGFYYSSATDDRPRYYKQLKTKEVKSK
jgi:energy-coupling factor transporter ATP-binding protein EcfA2